MFKCYFLKQALPHFCSQVNAFVLSSLYYCSYSFWNYCTSLSSFRCVIVKLLSLSTNQLNTRCTHHSTGHRASTTRWHQSTAGTGCSGITGPLDCRLLLGFPFGWWYHIWIFGPAPSPNIGEWGFIILYSVLTLHSRGRFIYERIRA